MKRLTTLLLAAGLICSAFSAANAADIKAKGMWDFSFEYTNDSFDKHNSSDRFGAAQRLRTQIDVIASESLKGVVYFEIGDTHWGHAKDGASLGTDGRTPLKCATPTSTGPSPKPTCWSAWACSPS